MAIDAEAQGPETRMNRPNCRELRFVATPFAEIAPRRSPVRVRLAPCQEGLQIRAFGFHIRQGTDGEGLVVKFWSSGRLATSAPQPWEHPLQVHNPNVSITTSSRCSRQAISQRQPRAAAPVRACPPKFPLISQPMTARLRKRTPAGISREDGCP
jgi:hypothetical protein